MKDKLIVKSEKCRINTSIIILGIFFTVFISYLFNTSFQPKNIYEERLKALSFFVFISFIIYLIFSLLNQKVVYVYKDHFEIKRFFKTKTYKFSEIQSHYSKKFSGKYDSWGAYYLVLNANKKLTFVDTEYLNFHQFYFKITGRIKINKKLNEKISHRKYLKYSIICGILAILSFYLSSHFYNFKKTEDHNFVFITGKLNAEIKTVKGAKGSRKFEINLVDYPNFSFLISGINYNAIESDEEFLKSFKKDQDITIGIDKEEYEKKISETKKPNFFDKYFRYCSIEIRQVQYKNISFIDVEKVTESRKRNNYAMIVILSLLGLLFVYFTIRNLKIFKKYN
ncbi:hypothetical protein [uncultured Chryseobacterium sp.]|uniref:hypothetical protein n=1 Tax=uncultured Chryseobacterium sp. TaxID=259322 RepID=UPI0025DE22F1|nr:hypothetical protein [uncultured Chryseobacterium sp.]